MKNLKFYFAGSIRGGREDTEIYLGIVDHLKTYGKVLTEHVADKNLATDGRDNLSDEFIHDRDMKCLYQSDAIIAEVTKPSLGVGYEIGRIVERNLHMSGRKPILCLYRPSVDKNLSAMIAGSDDLKVVKYNDLPQAKKAIDNFVKGFSKIKSLF